MLQAIYRKILVESNFNILTKFFKYKPKQSSNDEAISQVVLWNLLCILISGLVCFTLGYLGAKDQIPKGLEIVLPIILSALIGFDVVKEVPSEIIRSRLSETYALGEKNGKADRQTESISVVQEKCHLYYLSRLTSTNGTTQRKLEELVLRDISPQIQERITERTLIQYEKELQMEFAYLKQLRSIRCSIHSIPDEVFQEIALAASMKTLGLQKNEKLKMEYGSDYYTFFLDVYSYLQAWMICSIDNDSGTSMPATTIGMNYPSRNAPEVHLYLDVFRRIHRMLQEQSRLNLYVDAVAIKTIQERIGELIRWIEGF
ncbi:MAG: hypothetical protein NW224_08370 [Leptolyngbyaceae cyanobacterium bins.302]|nr:hypothetical protein [Leptolyngbyaceae cyanobacterium bins.302]